MGFFDKFLGKKEKEPDEITPENSKGKIVRSYYDDQGMIKKREVYKEKSRLSFKVSPETKESFHRGVEKTKRGFQKADKAAQRLNRAFDDVADQSSDFGLFGNSMFGDEPPKKKGKRRDGPPEYRWF